MRTREFLLIFLIIDLILLGLSLVVINWFGDTMPPNPMKLMITLMISWILVYLIFIDNIQYLKADYQSLFRALFQRFATFIATSSILLVSFGKEFLSVETFLVPLLLFGFIKFFLSFFLFHRMKLRNNKGSNMLIIGDNLIGNQIYKFCKENEYIGYVPLGILSVNYPKKSEIVIGSIDDFQKIYDTTPFNSVIISLSYEKAEIIRDLIFLAEKNGVRPRVVPNWYKVINRNFVIGSLSNIPLLDLRNVPLYHYPNRFWKRAFDLIVASALILILLPFFIVIMLLIVIDSKGPILYKPVRLGVDGKPFTLYKFRSMSVDDDPLLGSRSTVLNDERVTKFGRFIRKTNIDELPQLFNVVMNEMSLVGPRPHRVILNKELQKKMNYYMVRHFIKPGITGWAQVKGWRGPTESRLQYMGRTLHDLWYIEHWTFWLDMYIIFLTIFGKKSRKNAF